MGSAVSFAKKSNKQAKEEKDSKCEAGTSTAAATAIDRSPRLSYNSPNRAEERGSQRNFSTFQENIEQDSPRRLSPTIQITPVHSPYRSQNSSSAPPSHSTTSSNLRNREMADILLRNSMAGEFQGEDDFPVAGSETNSNADLFAQAAMSLGLENEDLLFNMMYFDDGSVPNFGAMMNTMQQETVALHSDSNTPYKLNPADEETISSLLYLKYLKDQLHEFPECECQVCKDELEDGDEITRIPTCKHYFHTECLSKWIHLVSSIYFILYVYILFYHYYYYY
jgi:hypothetical protein